MRTLFLFIAALTLMAGCACTQKMQKCPTCPECPACKDDAIEHVCLPDPTPQVFCYRPVDVRVGDSFERHWVASQCHPDCVDLDGVWDPDCRP